MTKGRYWIKVGQSANKFRRDIRAITAPSLADAERKAQNWLRIHRLTKVDGQAWDRWSVSTPGGHHGLPRLVAHGDHCVVAFTEREHGWID